MIKVRAFEYLTPRY